MGNEKPWGLCPQTPAFAKGQRVGGNPTPTLLPERIYSVAVNPAKRHKNPAPYGSNLYVLGV